MREITHAEYLWRWCNRLVQACIREAAGASVIPEPVFFLSHCLCSLNRSHLEMMLSEQLKNASRAVVEQHHPAYT